MSYPFVYSSARAKMCKHVSNATWPDSGTFVNVALEYELRPPKLGSSWTTRVVSKKTHSTGIVRRSRVTSRINRGVFLALDLGDDGHVYRIG